MAIRITGLATGLDIDAVIKETMQAYRAKIDVQEQKKDILEIKQKLYRDIMNEAKDFYNKYFDIANNSSLLLSSNYQAARYESSNTAVLTVKGSSEATLSNYTISGNIGTAAKAVLTEDVIIDDKIRINGQEFTLKGDTLKDKAKNLNSQLKTAGINITVRYSDFAGTYDPITGGGENKSGLIFESTVLGSSSSFVIETDLSKDSIALFSEIEKEKEKLGKDAVAARATGIKVIDLINAIEADEDNPEKKKLVIKIGDSTVTINDISEEAINGMVDDDASELEKFLNEKLSDVKVEIENDNITFISEELGALNNGKSILIGSEENSKEVILENGEDAVFAETTVKLDAVKGKKIYINGNIVSIPQLEENPTSEEINSYVENVNKLLSNQGIAISVIIDGDNITFTSKNAGNKYQIEMQAYNQVIDESVINSTTGQDANIIVRDAKGGYYVHTGPTNTFTKDGVTFTFNGEIPAEGIQVTGKVDVKDTFDKIVNFINDYNKLVEKLNKLVTEKRARDYQPLTKEQRKELSEKEVELWDAKVEQGQLYRDSDLMRINNSLKEAMRTIVNGTGLRLEDIGITAVLDYGGTKNGTYSIDEKKLTEALENKMEDVKNLFAKTKPTSVGLSDREKYSQTGIMYRLKDILYNETISTSSLLAKKAGIEGTSTAHNNTLTKTIEEYQRKIKDMESLYSSKEQALYIKYASLENIMNKYNSQMTYLSQSLGLG